jgi:hypothetical protein
MAKIGDLQIGTNKIALNSCNEFFWPTDAYHLTINNPTNGPNVVYYKWASNDLEVVVYDTHNATETYLGNSISGPTILGGVARKK